MKALAVVGLFVAAAGGVLIAMFWLVAATTPDQSHLAEQVPVTVISAAEERRASSSNRFGHRVEYAYSFAGTTYVDDAFVPLQNWQPGLPLSACIDADSPADHALLLRPEVECGTYVGTEQTATPQ